MMSDILKNFCLHELRRENPKLDIKFSREYEQFGKTYFAVIATGEGHITMNTVFPCLLNVITNQKMALDINRDFVSDRLKYL